MFMSTRPAPMLEMMAENSGAPRRRSGRNAIQSSATLSRPATTAAHSRATGNGAENHVTAYNPMNAPHMNTAPCARFRMWCTPKISVKPSANNA
jgi:hypothetical protein